MGFNDLEIRKRLEELKLSKKLSNYEFCKIYAPEKCKTQKDSLANNYISAIFSGRNYPKETSGPAKIELVHLQNIIDSDIFPGITMNYLLYGDNSPAKKEKVIDLNLEKWSLADFCELIWRLKTQYPDEIEIENNVEVGRNRYDPEYYWDEEYQKRSVTITIEEMNDIDYSPGKKRFSLGQALSLFHYEIRETEKVRDLEIREFGLNKVVKEIREREDFVKSDLSDCNRKSPFFIAYGD